MKKVRIIAEIGSNHMGVGKLALAHIEAAAGAGCDGVKFQLFRPEFLEGREVEREELRRWALPAEWIPQLAEYTRRCRMEFSCTPFDLEGCKILAGWVDAVKISAYDLTYDALLREAAMMGGEIVLSTAMATWGEIGHALEVIDRGRAASATPKVRARMTLLQGVAAYPAKLRDMNLRVLRELGWRYLQCGVGISDHTLGWLAAVVSVGVGGTMVEKHFKIDNSIESPDAGHSMTAAQMRILVEKVREAEEALGTGEKLGPLACEMALHATCRRSNEKPLRGEARKEHV